MRKARRTAAVVAVAAVVLVGGCSGPQGHATGPFTPPPCTADCGTSTISGPAMVGGVYDVAVLPLHNYSGRAVRLEWVRLLSPGGAGQVRVLNVRAYALSQVGGDSAIAVGDLPKTCPVLFTPHPVTDVTVAPRSDSTWLVYMALEFIRPHRRYHFGLAEVGYSTGGKSGWQDFQLPDITLTTVPRGPGVYYPVRCYVGKRPG